MAGARLFSFRYFYPETTDQRRKVQIRLLNVTRKYAKLIKKEYDSIVANWNHKVKFVSQVGFKNGDVFVSVSTDSETFNKVDEGFTRHRRMSRNWQSKTRPGTLKTFPGRGKPLRYDPKFSREVEPRDFGSQIESIYLEEFETDILRAIEEGFEAVGKVYAGKGR